METPEPQPLKALTDEVTLGHSVSGISMGRTAGIPLSFKLKQSMLIALTVLMSVHAGLKPLSQYPRLSSYEAACS